MLGAPKDNYVGQSAQENRGLLSIKNPIQNGKITDWEDMEKVWHHTVYCELVVAPEEHPVLMTELAATSRPDKEKIAKMMFEVFNVPALLIANQAVMSLYATGRTTGCVLDSGAGQTHCTPIWEGYALPHNLRPFPVAGNDITDHLIKVLREEGYPFSTRADRDAVDRMKETVMYVCENYAEEVAQAAVKTSYEREFKMPDGASIVFSQNRFAIPETMFNPAMISPSHADVPGIHKLMYNCVQSCDADLRRELLGNLVLAGGNTLFPKLEERLQREVMALAGKGATTKVVAFPERKYACWIGGSLLASLHTFPCMWVSKLEYDEYGVAIIHRKC